jgi:hypothetical protein
LYLGDRLMTWEERREDDEEEDEKVSGTEESGEK